MNDQIMAVQTARRPLMQPHWPVPTLLVLAGIIWLSSLGEVELQGLSDFGLVPALPPATFVALAILTVSFAFGLHLGWHPGVMLAHVLLLIVIIHGTPAIAYETVRYSWAWKHIGIVDFIQRTGTVDPDVAVLDVYHNWPGFFALAALITELVGFESAASFAAWSPVVFNVLNVGALIVIFRALSIDPRVTWLATWLFVIANWVGQDYFAPQALSYFMYLVVVGIALRWFVHRRPVPAWLSRFNGKQQPTFNGQSPSMALMRDESGPSPRFVAMLIAIAALGVIASSHQLSPIMAVLALGALAVTRLIERGLAALAIVFAAAWNVFVAFGYVKRNLEELGEFGGVVTTDDATLIDVAQASDGQVLVAFMGRGMVAVIALLAAAGAIRRLRRGKWDFAAAILAIAPALLLIANSYDGEILFRVYLFAVPFVVLFVAYLFFPSRNDGRSWQTSALVALLAGALTVPFLFAYYGKEAQYYFSPDEVAAAEYLYTTAPPGSLLVEGSRNYPAQFVNYEQFIYVPINREPEEALVEMIEDPVGKLESWLLDSRHPGAYVIITRSQKAEIDALGSMPAGSLDEIEAALLQSDKFTALFESDDARVFTLRSRVEVLS